MEGGVRLLFICAGYCSTDVKANLWGICYTRADSDIFGKRWRILNPDNEICLSAILRALPSFLSPWG